MEQSIYIKCDKCLFSKNGLYAILLATTILAGVSITLSFTQIIAELSSYLFLSISSLVIVFCFYKLIVRQEENYIFINNDEIWFKHQSQNENICLKFNTLNYFETRFSEIVFSTKKEEKIVLKLNRIADEKKRWEVKEFLKNHIPQTHVNRLTTLKTA